MSEDKSTGSVMVRMSVSVESEVLERIERRCAVRDLLGEHDGRVDQLPSTTPHLSPLSPFFHRAEVRFALLLALGLAGCGSPGPYSGTLYMVKGQVLLADGKPLTGGSIQFIPKQGGLPASGNIERDGTFSLKSKTREGAAPGEYKIRIEPSSELRTKKGKAAQKLPFASKYSEYDGNTGLTATVKAESTQLEPFRLESK